MKKMHGSLLKLKKVDPEAVGKPLASLFGYSTHELVDVTLSQSITVQRAHLKELAAGLGIDLQILDYDARCMLDSAIESVRDMKPENEVERTLMYNFVTINNLSREAALDARAFSANSAIREKAGRLFLQTASTF